MQELVHNELRRLSRDELIDLIDIFSKNWLTLDGLWFSGVEEKYGLAAALELDVRMWRIGSRVEVKRIAERFHLTGGGVTAVLRAINLMSWAPSFGYAVEMAEDRAVWTCTDCPPQRKRQQMGREEFACRPTFEACFQNLCQIIDPRVRVACRICPPGPHPENVWCQWEFRLATPA